VPEAELVQVGHLEQRHSRPGELGGLPRARELGVRGEVDQAGAAAQLPRLLAAEGGQPDLHGRVAVQPFLDAEVGLSVAGEDQLLHSSTER
jgi:hypothetical protein